MDSSGLSRSFVMMHTMLYYVNPFYRLTDHIFFAAATPVAAEVVEIIWATCNNMGNIEIFLRDPNTNKWYKLCRKLVFYQLIQIKVSLEAE